ncbi:MAG: copper resistance D family protein, partial [Actinomycetales bacterium]
MTGSRLGSRLWWGLVPLVALLWAVGAFSADLLPGVTVPPLLTQVAVPMVAYARDIALALTAGALLTVLLAPSNRIRRWALGWGVTALGLAVVALLALRADVTATQLLVSDDALIPILRDTAVGRASLFQVGAFVVAAVLMSLPWFTRYRWLPGIALGAVLVGIAALPIAGHAGVTSQHAVAGIATGVHAAAVLLWIGGLAAVSSACLLETDRAAVLLPRFSSIAFACVVIAAETGLLSASLIVGALGDLLGSSYGSLVVAKGVLLAWLIRLGWVQRRSAIDRLPDRSVPATVARMAGIEFLAMGAALAASVVLVRLGPPPLPGTGFAPLTLVALGIGVPLVGLQIWPGGWRRANALPEAAMMVFLLVVIEVGGVGLLRAALGPSGLLVELAVLLLAGWLAVAASRFSVGATWIGILGLPIAMGINLWLGDAISWR